MRPDYAEWVEKYLDTLPNRYARGKCKEATDLMVKAFPELRQVCGFAHVAWGEDQHWWCVAPDGEIVDPTVSQFPCVFEYEELDLSNAEDVARIPTGKCMNCGELTYSSSLSRDMCSEACAEEFDTYLKEELNG